MQISNNFYYSFNHSNYFEETICYQTLQNIAKKCFEKLKSGCAVIYLKMRYITNKVLNFVEIVITRIFQASISKKKNIKTTSFFRTRPNRPYTKEEKQKFLEAVTKEGMRVADLFHENLQNITLKNVEQAGLTLKEIALIQSNAASFLRFDKFIQEFSIEQGHVATLLGTALNELIFDLKTIIPSRDYLDAYHQLTGQLIANTPLFMEKLVQEGEPVIMFIPYDLSKASVTHGEIQWLIQHPDAMKNIHFVYGAYDALKSSSFGIIDSKFIALADDFKTEVFKIALNELMKRYKGIETNHFLSSEVFH